MASGDRRRGKEPAAEEEMDKFPEGLRVLAVDNDRVCLRVLHILLKLCKYNATMVKDARTALNMLRDGGEDQFDLVITEVHMPDMDGFKLLELVGLEMDLPVIMLSANGEKDTIYKGIEHGACDYIVKPPNIKKLRNIWQHVLRKKQVALNHSSSDHSDDADQRVVQPVIAERENGGTKSRKCSKKKKNDGDNSNRESTRVQPTRKKPRVSWAGELHARFLEVVNQLGVDKAVPKTILHMMNVKNLSRGSVGSHLQKFRLHLKRVADQPKKSDSLGDSSQKRNSSCYMDMNQAPMNHPGQLPPAVCFYSSNNRCPVPSILGPHGLSIQPRNRTMGTYHTMLDALSPSHSDQAYVSVLREKLLEPSSMVPTSHPGNSSFADMPIGGLSEHVNQFPVQPPELIGQFSGPMYTAPSAVSTHRDGQFPYIVGNSRNHWQNAGSSSSPIHMDGAPLSVSQVNIPQMNQLSIFGASSGRMPMLQNEQQNQMEVSFNNSNKTQVFSFSEQMTPLFDIASNTRPVEMTHDFSPMTQMMVNSGSTSSPLPNLQMGSYVAPPARMVNGGSISSAFPDLQDSFVAPPTQMVNGEDASGISPVQDGPADQPTYSNSNFLEENFASMDHQDFNPDDAFFGGEY